MAAKTCTPRSKHTCKYGKRVRGCCPQPKPRAKRGSTKPARRAAKASPRVSRCPEVVRVDIEKDGCLYVEQGYRGKDGKLHPGDSCDACPDEYGMDEACLMAMVKPRPGCPSPRVVQREKG